MERGEIENRITLLNKQISELEVNKEKLTSAVSKARDTIEKLQTTKKKLTTNTENFYAKSGLSASNNLMCSIKNLNEKALEIDSTINEINTEYVVNNNKRIQEITTIIEKMKKEIESLNEAKASMV